ncbi:MAG: hypothetical protein JWM72_1932, partial [Actinomycetia bacterium]|nr:hypothetical protein [Actinomycetes bacterium]
MSLAHRLDPQTQFDSWTSPDVGDETWQLVLADGNVVCAFDPVEPGVLVAVDAVDPEEPLAAHTLAALFGHATPADGWRGHDVEPNPAGAEFRLNAWRLALAEQTSRGYPLDEINPTAPVVAGYATCAADLWAIDLVVLAEALGESAGDRVARTADEAAAALLSLLDIGAARVNATVSAALRIVVEHVSPSVSAWDPLFAAVAAELLTDAALTSWPSRSRRDDDLTMARSLEPDDGAHVVASVDPLLANLDLLVPDEDTITADYDADAGLLDVVVRGRSSSPVISEGRLFAR